MNCHAEHYVYKFRRQSSLRNGQKLFFFGTNVSHGFCSFNVRRMPSLKNKSQFVWKTQKSVYSFNLLFISKISLFAKNFNSSLKVKEVLLLTKRGSFTFRKSHKYIAKSALSHNKNDWFYSKNRLYCEITLIVSNLFLVMLTNKMRTFL